MHPKLRLAIAEADLLQHAHLRPLRLAAEWLRSLATPRGRDVHSSMYILGN